MAKKEKDVVYKYGTLEVAKVVTPVKYVLCRCVGFNKEPFAETRNLNEAKRIVNALHLHETKWSK